MKNKEIKSEIYKHYSIHRKAKIKLMTEKMMFRLRLGDCECEIPYPRKVVRELKIENILC